MKEFKIDPSAKQPILLTKRTDSNGKEYYIGKLQSSIYIDLEAGNSMFVFISEDGSEEIQMSPMDPSKRTKTKRNIITQRMSNEPNSKIYVPLIKRQDSHGKDFFVGEWHGIGMISAREGLFFTVFVSEPGKEEIQISNLNHKDKEEVCND